jgi:hypothetical protein
VRCRSGLRRFVGPGLLRVGARLRPFVIASSHLRVSSASDMVFIPSLPERSALLPGGP